MIDFAALNRTLLQSARTLLSELLPGGRIVGQEYVCASLQGGEGRSCSVNLNTGKWGDFANDLQGGDLISLYAKINGINNGQAAARLEQAYTSGRQPEDKSVTRRQATTYPAPDNAQPCKFKHPIHGEPTAVWTYRNEKQRIWGYVGRYTKPDGQKTYCPFTWSGKKWELKNWSRPCPLYGLDDLALRPDSPVLIVEGEKSVEAARTLTSRFVVITWPGGSNRWQHADWVPVYGRVVLLWPDNDQPGVAAMLGIAELLRNHCPAINIIDPPKGKPKNWDAADAIDEGWTRETVTEWARTSIKAIPAPPTPAPYQTAEAIKSPEESPSPAGREVPIESDFLSQSAKWVQWRLDTQGRAGIPVANVSNVNRILAQDPQLSNLVWYDEFLGRLQTGTNSHIREWTDADEIRLQIYVQSQIGIKNMGDSHVHRAVIAHARANPKHCVRDWLETLVWDGIPRIDFCFERYFGTKSDDYHRAASKNFWLSMVARVYRPGCKVDNMIILQGGQGLHKSMALEVIGGPYWTSQHESVTSKAFFEVIQGKLLIEIGEWDSFSRAEISKVKDVVSCPSDRYRIPYDQYAQDHPRQCIFAANTNKDDWNKDETGARRFWPIIVGGANPELFTGIDINALMQFREQLFAEAVRRLSPHTPWIQTLWRFKGGETWWEMPDETATIQQDTYVRSVWQDVTEEFLYGKTKTTMTDIFAQAIKKDTKEITRKEELAMGAALRALGWERYTYRDPLNPNKVERGWKREI